MRAERAAAVIVAAGRGERFGGSNKVLAPLNGSPVLAYSLATASAVASIGEIVVVVAPEARAAVASLVTGGAWPKVRAIVDGGQRRQDSVAAGIAAVSGDVDLVAIHDGARPLAAAGLFAACLVAAAADGAAIAAVPVTDTLKRVDGHRIEATVPRVGVWAAQTPQAFRRDLLMWALADSRAIEQTYTDEAALFEVLGLAVTVVPGSRVNLKITHPDDLALAEALLRARRSTLNEVAP